MPTVIVAHVATPSLPTPGSGRYFRMMLDALRGEFADAPLYADISALAAFNRAFWLKRLARLAPVHCKLVYGSDFPIFPSASSFRWLLGRKYAEIQAIQNWIDRDAAIKAALGFGEDVFARGGELLAPRTRAGPASARPRQARNREPRFTKNLGHPIGSRTSAHRRHNGHLDFARPSRISGIKSRRETRCLVEAESA
jgi:hypothetical protein